MTKTGETDLKGDALPPAHRHLPIDPRRLYRSDVTLQIVAMILLYGLAGTIGFVGLVLLFWAGALSSIEMLFFRGLVLAAIVCVGNVLLLVAVVRRWFRSALVARDAFSAALVSLSFNICFLVLLPVTLDRSISIFVLGEMATHPEHIYPPGEMNGLFAKIYIGDYRQIDRRMREQSTIGNIEPADGGYRISARGRKVIELSRFIVWLFGGDSRFVTPRTDQQTSASEVDPGSARPHAP